MSLSQYRCTPRQENRQIYYMQASLSKERSSRGQIVASLKDTIAGLKAAGDVEGRLKAQVVALHGQVTEAQRAQVHNKLPCNRCRMES